jgi:hypothetical protein
LYPLMVFSPRDSAIWAPILAFFWSIAVMVPLPFCGGLPP